MSRVLPLAAVDSPIFPTVAIIGFGFMGGSLGLAIKRRWPSTLLIAVDEKPVLEMAMRMHAADVAGESLVMAAEASLVVLAAPVRANIKMLRELPAFVPGQAIVTDLGSTKVDTVAAAESLPERLQFIGGHPLAGAALVGVSEARAELFEGRPWLLTPTSSTDAAALAKLRGFVEGAGASPVELPAADHDRIVAFLSHLPQLAVTALMHVVGTSVGEDGLALAGRGLRDTTRLASSPAGIWRDIAATNPAEIAAALDAFIEILRRLQTQLADPGGDFDTIFASAARWKATLDSR